MAWLEQNKPALANQLEALPWVADGVDSSEHEAAQRLVDLAVWFPDVFDALLKKSWVQDSITADETIAIAGLRWMSYTSELSALNILGMQFLDSVEGADGAAAYALYELIAWANEGDYEKIMAHPTLTDGITDDEAKIVALLFATNRYQPQQVNVLLNGTGVYLEERTITLPHSGEVLLTIIRLREVKTRSMDLLEHAVRVNEDFMGEPYYTNWIATLFDPTIALGAGVGHHGTYMGFPQKEDDDTLQYMPFHFAHEVAHYYWRGSTKDWIEEGTAELLGHISEHRRVGTPIQAKVYGSNPCPSVTTLAQLEALGTMVAVDPEFECNYYLGERLFLDLYHTLGEETFRPRLRNLYLKFLRDDPADDCEGTDLGICHLETALKAGASDDVAAMVDEVVGRWYYGTVPMAKVPNCAEQRPDRADLCEPIQPPEHMTYIWWDWKPDQAHFEELVTDFTVHNDVGDFSDKHGLYLMVGHSNISDTLFYFGVQTDANRRGKAVIFSRWETDDLANARWDETDGWHELGKHEGGFLGVRRTYDWGAGDYRIRIGPDGLDSDGEWFGLWITDLDTGDTTWVGSLKFPLLDGDAKIKPNSYSTLEIYGNEPIRPIDIPQWYVSIKRPVGDNVPSVRGLPGYGLTADSAIRNSEVRYDSDEDIVHFQVGGTTERKTPATGHVDFNP